MGLIWHNVVAEFRGLHANYTSGFMMLRAYALARLSGSNEAR
jgi:hypothetical protein